MGVVAGFIYLIYRFCCKRCCCRDPTSDEEEDAGNALLGLAVVAGFIYLIYSRWPPRER